MTSVPLGVTAGPLVNKRGHIFPCPRKGGGVLMVTYDALFAYTLVIIGVVALFVNIKKK